MSLEFPGIISLQIQVTTKDFESWIHYWTIPLIFVFPYFISTLVDYLANVFDVLRCDLKDERAKELYLRYQATPVILPYMKAGNRAVMGCAVDIFLQMSMEIKWVEMLYFV